MGKKRDFLPFEEARAVVRELNINSVNEWEKLSSDIKHPLGIPACPALYYKNKGWTNWVDFLRATPRIKTYEEARAVARTLGIKSSYEWFKGKRSLHRGLGIPLDPLFYYKNKGWVNWNDFLGVLKKTYLSYAEAKKIVKTLGIKSSHEWNRTKSHLRENLGLPTGPHHYYKKKGWAGWSDFLGVHEKPEIKHYNEAKEIAKTLGINSSFEWMSSKAELRRIPGLPANPRLFYKNKGWSGWGDFLGRDKNT